MRRADNVVSLRTNMGDATVASVGRNRMSLLPTEIDLHHDRFLA
jgi:hypothetical protein